MDNLTILVLGVIAVGVWLWFRPWGGAARGEEAQLRRICFGDAAQAERLIEGEIARAPGISRAEAVARAVRRYQRDNR